MKKAIGLILTLAACTGMLMAQKSQYFTYDRERIDREMAMITEATVKQGSFDLLAGDSVKARQVPIQAFYIIGLGSGNRKNSGERTCRRRGLFRNIRCSSNSCHLYVD